MIFEVRSGNTDTSLGAPGSIAFLSLGLAGLRRGTEMVEPHAPPLLDTPRPQRPSTGRKENRRLSTQTLIFPGQRCCSPLSMTENKNHERRRDKTTAQTLSGPPRTSVVSSMDFTWRRSVPCCSKGTQRKISKQREKKNPLKRSGRKHLGRTG